MKDGISKIRNPRPMTACACLSADREGRGGDFFIVVNYRETGFITYVKGARAQAEGKP